jgi:predicted nuclease with TOPRIM domain
MTQQQNIEQLKQDRDNWKGMWLNACLSLKTSRKIAADDERKRIDLKKENEQLKKKLERAKMDYDRLAGKIRELAKESSRITER